MTPILSSLVISTQFEGAFGFEGGAASLYIACPLITEPPDVVATTRNMYSFDVSAGEKLVIEAWLT